MNIHFYICQALAESFGKQLYQAPVSKLLLASAVGSGFGGCLWDGSPGVGQSLDGDSFSLYIVSVTPSMGILFPLLRRILSFWAYNDLSMNAYHVCSFVIGLSHIGRYYTDPSISIRIS